MSEWFKQWFNEDYLMLYEHRNEEDALLQIELILAEIPMNKRTKILDLCCGSGRHTKILDQKGYKVKGIDLSEILIKMGKAKYPFLNLKVEDMRDFKGNYDVILSLFTSFGYFASIEENEEVINIVFKRLNNGGYFWLDFFNKEEILKSCLKETIKVFKHKTIEEKKVIKLNRIEKEIKIKDNLSKEEKIYQESVRLFSKEELCQLMEKNNFKILKVFGNYQGLKWKENSERTIILGQKLNDF